MGKISPNSILSVIIFTLMGILFLTSSVIAQTETSGKENFVAEVVDGKGYVLRKGKQMNIKEGDNVLTLDTIKTEKSEVKTFLSDDDAIIIFDKNSSSAFKEEYTLEGKKGKVEGSGLYFMDGKCTVFTCDQYKMHSNTAIISAGKAKTNFLVWKTSKDWLKNQAWMINTDWNRTEWASINGQEPITCAAVLKNSINIRNVEKSVKGDEDLSLDQIGCVADGSPPVVESISKDLFEQAMIKENVKYITRHTCRTECPTCLEYNHIENYLYLNRILFDRDITDLEKDKIGEIIGGYGKINRGGEVTESERGDYIILKDTVKTYEPEEIDFSGLKIFLTKRGMLILGAGEKSSLSVLEYFKDDKKVEGKSKFFLEEGRVRAVSCEESIDIYTSVAKASSKGDDFLTWITQKKQIDDQMRNNKWTENKDWADISNEAPVTCVAVFEGAAYLQNTDPSIKEKVLIPGDHLSCIAANIPPIASVQIPDNLNKKLLTKEMENERFLMDVCEPECVPDELCICGECERLNPQGKCIPDNHKPCDDGDPCTIDDICLGRKCMGKRDPSPIDPACELEF
jgi:hypothetical protein